MNTIQNIILKEEIKLGKSGPAESVNILYNLIIVKNKIGQIDNNYKEIKKFIDEYIKLIQVANYGYDTFNYCKIDNLLNILIPEEQISILQYAISTASRELPEHDREWFLKRKRQAEIKDIIFKKKKWLYFKALFLYCGQNIYRLLLTLIVFIFIINILLLPAPISSLAIFSLTYDKYSNIFFLNHSLNILSLFADLENNFKIIPLNWMGLLLFIIGKISFVLLIANFIYIKISDTILIK